jgi:Flp pilus assembly secretin CpaC
VPERLPFFTLAMGIAVLAWLGLAGAALGQDAAKGMIKDTDVQLVPEGGPPKKIEVGIGRSRFLRTAWKVKRVSIGEPKIADVQLIAADQVLIQGKALGTTSLVVWNEQEQAWQAQVMVVADLGELKQRLAELLPGAALELRSTGPSKGP